MDDPGTSSSGEVSKPSKLPLEKMPHEDLVKQVKRQLILLQKMKAKCDELSNQCTEMEKQHAQDSHQHSLQLQDLHSVITDLKEKEQRAQATIEEIETKQVQQLQELETRYVSECQRLEKELVDAGDEVVKFRRRCHLAEEQCECMQMKLDTLTSTCHCLQEELNNLRDNKKELEDQICVLTKARDTALEAIATLKREKKAFEESADALKTSMEEMTKENRDLKQKLEEMINKCHMSSDINSDGDHLHEGKCHFSESRGKDLPNFEAIIAAEMRDKDDAIKQLKDEKNDLLFKFSSLQNENKSLSDELNESLHKIMQFQSELMTTVAEKDDLVKELLQMKDMNSFIEEEAKSLRDGNEKMKIQMGRLEADLENDRLHILRLENELVEAGTREKNLQEELEKFKERLNSISDDNSQAQCLDTVQLWEELECDKSALIDALQKLQRYMEEVEVPEATNRELNCSKIRSELHLMVEMLMSYQKKAEDVVQRIYSKMMSNEYQELEKQLVELQNEKDTLTMERCLHLGQIEELTNTIKQLELHISHLQHGSCLSGTVYKEVKSDANELTQKIRILEESVMEKSAMIDKIHARLDDLLTRNEELMSDIEDKEKDLETLKAHVQQLENTVLHLKAEITEKDHLIADLESAKDHLDHVETCTQTSEQAEEKKSMEMLQDQLDQQTEEIKHLKDLINQQTSFLKLESDEKLRLQQEYADISVKLSVTSEKMDTLENELEKCYAKCVLLEKDNESLQDEIKTMKRATELAVQKLKDVFNKEVASGKLNNDAEIDSQNDINEIDLLQNVIEKMQTSVEFMRTEYENRLSVLKEENEHLHIRLKELNDVRDKESHVTTEETQKQQNDANKLQESLKEMEDRMNKFKLVAVKVKKELAEVKKQLSDVGEERDKLKRDLEHVSASSWQHLHNFQVLQAEYDKLQDEHEALKSAGKQMEQDLARVVTELGDAQKHSSDLMEELDNTKKLLEVTAAERKAVEQVCKELEGKIIVIESQASAQQEQLKSSLAKAEQQVHDLEEKLQKEKEHHQEMMEQINQAAKEAQQHSVLDLEMADYERTVSGLMAQLDQRDNEIVELKEQLAKTEENVSSLQLELEHVDKQRSTEEDRANNLKQLLTKAKEELTDSRNAEQELQNRVYSLQSQLELLNTQSEHCKLQLTECLAEKNQISQMLKSCREAHQKATKMLEMKISSLEEELQTCHVQLESKSAEFENYKVRVCNVLKQQKKPETGQDLVHKENLAKLQKTVEQLRTRVQELTDQLQASTAENDALHCEHSRLLQRHTKIVNEVNTKDRMWTERLENLNREKAALNSEITELKQQVLKQKEIISNTFKQLESMKESNEQAVGSLQKQLDAANKEITRLQSEHQKGPAHMLSYQSEDSVPFDIWTSERQEGEGSECTNTGSTTPVKNLSFATVPTGGFVPFEQLIHSATQPDTPTSLSSQQDVNSLETNLQASQKKIEHLNELLNESEAHNLRLNEQSRLLKEEIRRLQRNKEREEHVQNLEYLKNVVLKFLTLRDEREHLIPVLTTMLRLSPSEQGQLQAVTNGDAANRNQEGQGWGSYLHRWSGIA